MKTVIIMYMPGHAGNFVQRLLGLSRELMPILEKTVLNDLVTNWRPVDPLFDKLSNYKFSQVPVTYANWQRFHRSYADYLDWQQYRWLNLISGCRYNFIYAIHPHEFDLHFLQTDNTIFYFIDLDPKYNSWVEREQSRLKFVWRDREQEQFDTMKQQYAMKPISLSALIDSEESFVNEYLRLCAEICITPALSQATELRQDWLSVRYNESQ